jgi:hypothetical protein
MSKVTIFLQDSKDGHIYDGKYDVVLGPEGVLIVNEEQTDGFGAPTIPRIRTIYNNNDWQRAVLGDSDAVEED